jgi:hypothetical protein
MDKERFLKPRLREIEVALDGVGTLRVRALNRDEAMRLRDLVEDPAAAESFVLRAALVDPALTDDEITDWRRACPPDEIETVLEKIFELSGLTEGAQKSGRESAAAR